MRDDSLEVVLRGLFPAAFLSQSLSSDINLAMCMSASLSSSFCKLGTCRRLAILSPLTLAGTPQWSGIAPTGLANPQRVSQLLKPALVHCLEVACGYCEAELSPALPGTPQRGLTPKGERKFSGLELMGGFGGGAASCPSWRWGNMSLQRSWPFFAYPSWLRPDPLLHCWLKLTPGREVKKQWVLPPVCPPQLGAVSSLVSSYLPSLGPSQLPCSPSSASTGRLTLLSQGLGSGVARCLDKGGPIGSTELLAVSPGE